MMWKISLSLILFLGVFSSCTNSVEEKPELKKYFDEYQVDGCFLLYNVNTKNYSAYNNERAKLGFLPASTFKIPNTLIGLQTGVIKDTSLIWEWDEVERWYGAWNQNQSLQSAFQYSCVPAYQNLARNIGFSRMKAQMDSLNYGAFKFDASNLDTFWLFGESRVTCYDQIDLLNRIFHFNTHFKKEYVEILEKIMVAKQNDTFILRAKTGGAEQGDRHIGWYVGSVETQSEFYLFALNIESEDGSKLFREARKDISLKILEELKIINSN